MNPWHSLRGLPGSVWALAAATFVNRVGSMVLPLLVLYLTQDKGMAPATAGSLLAVYGAIALVVAPVSGRFCDRVGAKRVLVACLASSGLVLMAYPWVRGTPALIGMTLLAALTSEPARPAALTLAGSLVPPEQRKQAFSLVRLALNLGLSVGPAAGGALAMLWFPAVFLVDGITSVLAAILLVVLLPEPRRAATHHAASVAGPPPWAVPAFRRFLIATLLSSSVFFQLQSSMPLFIVGHLGLTKADFGLVFTINTLIIVLFEVGLQAATTQWPPHRSLALGALIFSIGIASTGLATGFASLMVTVLIWTFGEMLLFPAGAAFATDSAPHGRTGVYMGWYSTAFGLGFTLGPWGGTFLLAHAGPAACFGSVLVVGLIAVLLYRGVQVPRAAA